MGLEHIVDFSLLGQTKKYDQDCAFVGKHLNLPLSRFVFHFAGSRWVTISVGLHRCSHFSSVGSCRKSQVHAANGPAAWLPDFLLWMHCEYDLVRTDGLFFYLDIFSSTLHISHVLDILIYVFLSFL
jgi:hypothetical protein